MSAMCDGKHAEEVAGSAIERVPLRGRNVHTATHPGHDPAPARALQLAWLPARGTDILDVDEVSAERVDVGHRRIVCDRRR
jgi:hypothetical protein